MNASSLPDGHFDAPLTRFAMWWAAARAANSGVIEPDAMVLSTVAVDADGAQPSSRVVYLRAFDASWSGGLGALAFYTNLESRKGRELRANDRVALNFHWAKQERQVRVEGRAHRVEDAMSDAYWATRPRESQIGGWASQQSREIPPDASLEDAVRFVETRFASVEKIPRPSHWGGVRVVPAALEFWQMGAFRLHRRERYERSDRGPMDHANVGAAGDAGHAGSWRRILLFP